MNIKRIFGAILTLLGIGSLIYAAQIFLSVSSSDHDVKALVIYESAALFSYLAVKAVMILIVSVVALLLTIAVALWIGDVLEKTAYGFLIMGMFYIIIGTVVFIFRKPLIKNKVSNHTIRSFKLPKD